MEKKKEKKKRRTSAAVTNRYRAGHYGSIQQIE
jgi:hypothetical protein